MDTKKVIEKLVKIADNQQKIINKLAQDLASVPQASAVEAPAQVSSFDAGTLQIVMDKLTVKLPGNVAMQYKVLNAVKGPAKAAVAVSAPKDGSAKPTLDEFKRAAEQLAGVPVELKLV